MTEKERRFCRVYLETMDAQLAAEEVGLKDGMEGLEKYEGSLRRYRNALAQGIHREVDIVQALYLLEQVLPAHGYITCALRYLDADTGELVNEKKTLGELRKRTKAEWNGLMQ